jgi:hypothetical protein
MGPRDAVWSVAVVVCCALFSQAAHTPSIDIGYFRAPVAGEQSAGRIDTTIGGKDTYVEYWLYAPPAYASRGNWPAIICVSDFGTCLPKDLLFAQNQGLANMLQGQTSSRFVAPPSILTDSFVVVSPQVAIDGCPDTIAITANALVSRYKADPRRIYLMGNYTGAARLFDFAGLHPSVPAATVLIEFSFAGDYGSGWAADPTNVCQEAKIPQRIYSNSLMTEPTGDQGADILYPDVQRAVDQIKACPQAASVLYDHHWSEERDMWTEIYGSAGTYTWLLSQVNGNATAIARPRPTASVVGHRAGCAVFSIDGKLLSRDAASSNVESRRLGVCVVETPSATARQALRTTVR